MPWTQTKSWLNAEDVKGREDHHINTHFKTYLSILLASCLQVQASIMLETTNFGLTEEMPQISYFQYILFRINYKQLQNQCQNILVQHMMSYDGQCPSCNLKSNLASCEEKKNLLNIEPNRLAAAISFSQGIQRMSELTQTTSFSSKMLRMLSSSTAVRRL